MKVSISNVYEDIEILFVTDDLRNKGVSRFFKNVWSVLCEFVVPGFFKSPLFHEPTSECGSWEFFGMSEYFRAQEYPCL